MASARGRAEENRFRLNYLLPSSLYGGFDLADVLAEAVRFGAAGVDLWPRPHGTQREAAGALAPKTLDVLVAKSRTRIVATTRYDLGPRRLQAEMAFLKRMGGELIVTGAGGHGGLSGPELKRAIDAFFATLGPTLAAADQAGLTIAIENHDGGLISSADSIRWLADRARGTSLKLALAPYHLPQDAAGLAALIRDVGDRLALFYAWQFGHGCMRPMPPAEECLQLPGCGSLDFLPLMQALRDVHFTGWTEIFMHTTPRGRAIADTAPKVTEEILRSRAYLERVIDRTRA